MTALERTAGAAINAAQADGLVGVIDIGSNSVRLVVFEDGARSPDYVFNEKVICGLGRGLAETGRLDEEAKPLTRATLRRHVALARRMGVGELLIFGTAALREAEDGPEFRETVEAELNAPIRVLTGREEARLSAEGVLFGWPAARGVVADMGGASLELASVADGEVTAMVSTPAGHLRLLDAESPTTRRSLLALGAAAASFVAEPKRLIIVGGAWRALAKAGMTRTNYPFPVLQGYEMAPDEALALCEWAISEPAAAIKRAAGVSTARIASLAAGARALRRLVSDLRPESVEVSAFGVREGVLYERMSPELRRQEPLIAAAEAMELRGARFPGFGRELFAWMKPILEGFTADRVRLAEATCLLHDVNWRAHPDFRVSACFGTVSRANLGGVGHRGRLFLGAALSHRYKGQLHPHEAAALDRLAPDARRDAEIVGRAIRLGAMVSGSTPGTLGQCALRLEEGALILDFAPEAADFAGERVQQRLEALAQAMGRAAALNL